MEPKIKRVSRTYVLPVETADAAKSLAAAVGTNVSHVVEKLLEKALEEVEIGHWSVNAIPVKYQMSITDATESRPQVTTCATSEHDLSTF